MQNIVPVDVPQRAQNLCQNLFDLELGEGEPIPLFHQLHQVLAMNILGYDEDVLLILEHLQQPHDVLVRVQLLQDNYFLQHAPLGDVASDDALVDQLHGNQLSSQKLHAQVHARERALPDYMKQLIELNARGGSLVLHLERGSNLLDQLAPLTFHLLNIYLELRQGLDLLLEVIQVVLEHNRAIELVFEHGQLRPESRFAGRDIPSQRAAVVL